MENTGRKNHWETIYQTKPLESVSWYQPVPETSLSLIASLKLPKTARIIDIGGGDSLLVDHLLQLGYTDLTVLDISEAALERARKRLGPRAETVRWIHSDVVAFRPGQTYDLWHDRAAFHFLTQPEEVGAYSKAAADALGPGGHLIIGTFSVNGPTKCSGLEIRQYDPASMEAAFGDAFRQTGCREVGHHTPGGAVQQFLFCTFERRGNPTDASQ